ncbi:hypothetical protein GCM10010116_39280 [Microbispora rosea subsp. aerata]|nr:hypothetical protein [Microbispora rosea]GGO19583.1 hypothetical protein GCM10010116_39280 [Microbispora rosea subsp. aerata]GIH54392.1 hypothetical protein Mro02_13060 [Microbispora rosea subsp. aerata]GLJ81363.1 hypothetical protein GCM10017588_00860 [Microbispora rosea subsp. aerata]
MDAESTICLSDLVPALRWSRPQQVAEMLADPRLPGGWWASVGIGRAMRATGVDWLCERLARLAVGRWDHLPLTDLLPALQVHTVDPAMPGWPDPVRTVVNHLGGWYRLRRLTPCDLQAPAAPASPEVLLTTVFREVFGRLESELASKSSAQAAAGTEATPQAPAGPASQPFPQAAPGAQAAPGVQAAPGTQAAAGTAAQPGTTSQAFPQAGSGQASQIPQAGSASASQPFPQPAAPQPSAPGTAQQRPFAQPGAPIPGQAPGAPAQQAPGAPAQQGPGAQQGHGPSQQGQAPGAPAPAPASPAPAAEPPKPTTQPFARQSGTPLPQPAAAPAQPAAEAARERQPADLSAHPMVAVVESLFRDWDPLARAVAAQRLFAAEPVSLRTLAHNLNVDRELLSQAQRTAEERVLLWLRSPDSAPLTGHLFGLTEWLGAAATQEQLIAADPSHPVEVPALGTPLWRVLVTLMPDRRLQDGWLVVGDLAGLREKTRQLLANKPADADVVELLGQLGIRAHSAKAWLDSMPKAAQPSEPGPLPTRHGPAEQASKPAPLPRRTPGANGHHHGRGGVPIPSQANNGPDPATALAALNALTNGNLGGNLSGNRGGNLAGGGVPRPHLVPPSPRPASSPASDPRKWQRIDVTSGHLRGEPVAVPEGYAAQLGMRPGTLLSVTGPGDNAVVLVWRDRQPVFDSLQPVLMRLNARPGDSVYVTVDGYRLDAQLMSTV